jgi:hypothetical protein
LHAQARGASGKYVQEKEYKVYLPLAQTGRSTKFLIAERKEKRCKKTKKKRSIG